MILEYKREFEDCKTNAQTVRQKVMDDVDQLIPENVPQEHEINWLIMNDKNEHYRKLKNKVSWPTT
jgi:hypothetical protein